MRSAVFMIAFLISGGCAVSTKSASVTIRNDTGRDVRVVVLVIPGGVSGFGHSVLAELDPLMYALSDPVPPGESIQRRVKIRSHEFIQCKAFRTWQRNVLLQSTDAKSDRPNNHFRIVNTTENGIAFDQP